MPSNLTLEEKFGFVCIGGMILILAFFGGKQYLKKVDKINTWNPIKQHTILEQRRNEEKQNAKIRYDSAYKKIFGPSGYADANFSTGVSFDEKVSAYRKMDFLDDIFVEGEKFPQPTIEQLEKAIESYEEK